MIGKVVCRAVPWKGIRKEEIAFADREPADGQPILFRDKICRLYFRGRWDAAAGRARFERLPEARGIGRDELAGWLPLPDPKPKPPE